MILDVLFTGVVALVFMKLWQRYIQRKEIWVIDDSDSDIMLLKINLQLDDYDVRYFKSVKGLKYNVITNPPAGVICDYYLKDNINGDQVREFFKRNHIPVILTTGSDGDINGVPDSEIIRKSTGSDFYRQIEKWVHATTI